MILMILFVIDIKNILLDTVREGEGKIICKSVETYILPYVK